jgi:hypothetical protein
MSEQINTGAREAIRIAEKIFPDDMTRQRDLARDIIGAINLCENEFAQEIIGRMKRGAQ